MFLSTPSPNQSSKKLSKSSLPSVASNKLLNQFVKKSKLLLLVVLVPLKALLWEPVLPLVVPVLVLALDSVVPVLMAVSLWAALVLVLASVVPEVSVLLALVLVTVLALASRANIKNV